MKTMTDLKGKWEKEWRKLSPDEVLKEGDGQRYVLAYYDEAPMPIQKHFYGLPAHYQSWFFYRPI